MTEISKHRSHTIHCESRSTIAGNKSAVKPHSLPNKKALTENSPYNNRHESTIHAPLEIYFTFLYLIFPQKIKLILLNHCEHFKPKSIHMLTALCFSALMGFPTHAEISHQTFYCTEQNLGWHFYCEDTKPKSSSKKASTHLFPKSPSTQPRDAVSAKEEVESIRSQLQELRAEAVLRPTEASVKSYITFQREQLDRASLFSDIWRRVIWANPDLDYTLIRPVGQTSKRDWIDQRKIEQEEVLENLHERYGLIYLYTATCSACRLFSPILLNFSTTFNLDIKAISTDGGANSYFPDADVDQGQITKLGLKDLRVPAVLLFDSVTKSLTPVSFGIVSEAELIERIYVLTNINPGADY